MRYTKEQLEQLGVLFQLGQRIEVNIGPNPTVGGEDLWVALRMDPDRPRCVELLPARITDYDRFGERMRGITTLDQALVQDPELFEVTKAVVPPHWLEPVKEPSHT